MAESGDIDFVRISILENWRFWHSFGDDYEAAGHEAIAQADALLAGDSSNERAARLLAEASEFRAKKQKAGSKGGFAKAARKKNLEALMSQKSLPGTSSGNGEAPNDEGGTAPAGENFKRADAHAREDWDASATVRAQTFDGDAGTREGSEAASSGFATSPSDFQNRPGKSAIAKGALEASGGSERGADGSQNLSVRPSPGAGKRPEPPTLEELYAFASEACLNERLCREWWEMTYGDRAGLDRDGRPIRNWKAACRAYVRKRISNMENER